MLFCIIIVLVIILEPFIEVNKMYSKNISNSFNGIYIDGRELRVNRDSKK